MNHHTHDLVCPLCWDKLKQAHSDLASWFYGVKKRYPNVHISWSFRGAEDQEKAVLDGKSKLHFPNSAHNKMDADGNPQSRALDLFLLDEDGVARFPGLWYAKLNTENEADQEMIAWGGSFKNLGDADHFQLI